MAGNIIHFPNKWQKYLAPAMAFLAAAPGIAFSVLPVFAYETPREMNWSLLIIMILTAYICLSAAYRLYSESRIAVILDTEGIRIIGAKNRPYSFFAWEDINYKILKDAFDRQYVMISTDNVNSADANQVMRNISKVIIADGIAVFRIDNAPEKDVMLEMLQSNSHCGLNDEKTLKGVYL